MPMHIRARMIGVILSAVPGVNNDAVDQRTNEMMSMMRPPYSCAAQPPGTCGGKGAWVPN
jgi:hypothetical protein